MSTKKKGRGRPSRFPPEFRRDAVAMVVDEDRSIADVGRSVGVNEGTLGNWVRLERIERGERDGLTVDERSELADLRSENAQFAAGTRSAQTIDGLLGEGVDTVTRFRCVGDQKAAGFPVTASVRGDRGVHVGLLRLVSGELTGPTEREIADAQLVELMREIHAAGDGAYGVQRMWRDLRNAGIVINKKKVHRLMRRHGMAGCCYRRGGPHHLPRPRRLRDPRPDRPTVRRRRARCRLGAGHRAPRGALEPCGGERTPPPVRRSGRGEAEGSLNRGTPVRVDSSPDNDGTGQHCQMVRARLARRKGVREEPAAERL